MFNLPCGLRQTLMTQKQLTSARQLLRICAVFVSCHCVATTALAEPKDILKKTAAQLTAIQSIELEFFTTYDGFKGPGVEPYGDHGLFTRWKWGWNRQANSQYLHGKHALDFTKYEGVGKYLYQEESAVFNGEKLRTFVYANKTGTIRSFDPGIFEMWRSPLCLMGYYFAFSGRLVDLPELLLSDKADWTVEQDSADKNKWHLSMPLETFPASPLPISEAIASRAIELTVDQKLGFMPVRTAIVNKVMDWVLFETLVDDVYEAKPGIWLPLSGTRAEHSLHPTMPPGMTEEDLLKLGLPEQIEFVKKNTKLKPLISYGREHYHVVKDSLKVNEPIEAAKFTFKFPDGSSIWDDIQGKEVIIGER